MATTTTTQGGYPAVREMAQHYVGEVLVQVGLTSGELEATCSDEEARVLAEGTRCTKHCQCALGLECDGKTESCQVAVAAAGVVLIIAAFVVGGILMLAGVGCTACLLKASKHRLRTTRGSTQSPALAGRNNRHGHSYGGSHHSNGVATTHPNGHPTKGKNQQQQQPTKARARRNTFKLDQSTVGSFKSVISADHLRRGSHQYSVSSAECKQESV